jgi:signal transduction histidine kinase
VLPRGLVALAVIGLVITLALLGRSMEHVSRLSEDAWQDGQAAAVEAQAAQLGVTLGLMRAMAVGIDPALMPDGAEHDWLVGARARYDVGSLPVELMVQDGTGRVRAATSEALVEPPHTHDEGAGPCAGCAEAGMIVLSGPPDDRGCHVSAVVPASALSPMLQHPWSWLVGPEGGILAHADPGQVGTRPFDGPQPDERLEEMLRRMAAGEMGSARYDWVVPESGARIGRLAAFAPVPGAPGGWSLATSSEDAESLAAVSDALSMLGLATLGQVLAGLGFTALLVVLLRRGQRQREDHLRQRMMMTRNAGHSDRLALIGTMTAGVAHDLRGPLTTLRINLELIDEPMHADEADDIRSDLRLAVDQLARLASDLTRFSRTEAEDVSACEPDRAIDTALRILGPAVRHDTVIDLSMPALPLAGISGQRLSQVIANLVHNASLVAGRVAIRAGEEGDDVWISVEDDGPGVPEAVRATLFDAFVTTRPAGEGTGLGLYLCNRFVRECGGGITLASEPGRLGGARFIVRLPRVEGGVLSRETGPTEAPSVEAAG